MESKKIEMTGMKKLIEMSRKYGADPEYVLAGGGNTSYKENGIMAVKASGKALSAVDEASFVVMDVEKLRALMQADYPDDDKAREACVSKDMMAARLEGQGDLRPSVECILHALFPQRYVLHVHPALINGLTCGKDGAAMAADLFDDMKESFIWMPLTKPGFVLSRACAELFARHTEAYGNYPQILMLQNHGIFVAADEVEEADRIMMDAVSRVSGKIGRQPNLGEGCAPSATLSKTITKIQNELAALYGGEAVYLYNSEISRFTESIEAYATMLKPFTPDYIVYCRAYPALADSAEHPESIFAEYEGAYGGKPRVVAVRGVGVFALGRDAREAGTVADLYIDSVKIAAYSESFGGPLPLPDYLIDFVVNWEVESYRRKVAQLQEPGVEK